MITLNDKLEDAVTGQCDHIIGLASYPSSYEWVRDRLVLQSEKEDVDEAFAYCPCCGASLAGKNRSIQNF